MPKKSLIKGLLTGTIAVLASHAASAAVITVDGSFSATDWQIYFGTPSAPIDPLFLDYSVTFDDALTYTDDAAPLTINSSNIPYPIRFSYQASGSAFVLATSGTPGGCTHTAGSFCAFVNDFLTGKPYFVEQSPIGGGGWTAKTITTGAPAVPEPATWAMMIGGFGMTGATLRRRRSMTRRAMAIA